MSLKENLIKQNKTRWLDVGCGRNFEEGFFFLDKLPKKFINPKGVDKYFKVDLLNATESQLKILGKFDFIRMQHIMEHFSLEEGGKVLRAISGLLKDDGVVLITVPDLRINVKKYISKEFKKWTVFNSWAWKVIPKDSPDSFYFSVYTHSLPVTPHKWCYDYEGLKYLLEHSGLFKKIKKIDIEDKLANVPFTHNRPEEDLCIMANKL
jgi:predicted SAM-dependent methyltransferase